MAFRPNSGRTPGQALARLLLFVVGAVVLCVAAYMALLFLTYEPGAHK